MKLGEQSVNGILCVKFVGFMFEACEIFHHLLDSLFFINLIVITSDKDIF